ncbi:MAG: S66 peptidase family protein [Bacteroidota bacterium]
MDRKEFLKKLTVTGGMLAAPFIHTSAKGTSNRASKAMLKPARVHRGDTAAIVSPAGSVVSNDDIEEAISAVRSLGLKPKVGKNLGQRWGYLGGRDSQRVDDLHNAFKDPEVKLIFPIRGGYGSSRLLPMIDFELIRRHPKAFVGFSDNTSLIVSMNQFAGLVTFYGPNALSDWTPYTKKHWQQMIMGEGPAGSLPPPHSERPSNVKSIVKGRVAGPLIGGNLSLLTQTLGTEWEIDTRDKILFFEDVNESAYRIDRMLTHLWLARKLQVAKGFAIGHMTNISSNDGLDVMEVLKDRLEPLGKPCFVGVSTGHISDILTLPVGVTVELDATQGVLKANESAVI